MFVGMSLGKEASNDSIRVRDMSLNCREITANSKGMSNRKVPIYTSIHVDIPLFSRSRPSAMAPKHCPQRWSRASHRWLGVE